MSTLRIVVADDHALVRAGLRALLERKRTVDVVGEARDADEAVRLVETLRPDVVLMDISMRGTNGLDATARLAREHPATKVIIVSMHASAEYVRQALAAGAAGYLLKDSAATELELALAAVRRNETYLSPALAGVTMIVIDLTRRQRDVLMLIARGRSTKEIALDLGVSAKTVETHRTRLMARLGIRDIPGLVRYAMRCGLVPPE